MAEKKYNLDNIISKYIHRPIIKSSSSEDSLPPLYARVGTDSESKLDLIGAKNPLWLQAVEERYNSPTNVRRLFIGDKKVVIQYFQPIYNKKSTNSSCWGEYAIANEDVIGDLANKALNHNKEVMEAAMNGAAKPDKPILTHTGLGAVSNDWKMSNIEEIYITSEILASTDIQAKFGDAEKIWQLFRTEPMGRMWKNDLPLKIFEYANGSDIKNIRNRFPRLRKVILASNLDLVMQEQGARGIKDGLPATTAESTTFWLKYMKDKGLANQGSFMVASVPLDKSVDPVLTFITRPGIYKYDATILQPYSEKFKAKVQEIRLEASGMKKDTEANSTGRAKEKSEYEKYLDDLATKHNESVITAALRLAFARVKADEIEQIFKEMTPDGAKKYRALLGR